MNPDWLLEHFDEISEVPDTVQRMRRFILDLAVRGKLVEQNPEDEPASKLLKRIDEEKAILIKAEKIKAKNRLPMPHEDAVDFKLPSSWKLVPLGEVAVCLDYRRVPINNEERTKRIEGKTPNELFPYYGATQQQGWIDDFIFDEELVLLGEDGVPFFETLRPKAYVISGKTWVNNHAHVFCGVLTSNRFLAHWLNVFDYTGRVAGATRSKLNQSKAIDIPVPLPPLAEQHRIVAKVDELMVLCDELEAAQTKRERRRDRLVAAALHGLNNGDANLAPGAPLTFEESARFYFSHLPRLTTRPEHIHQLRRTILNLAVRGKLVPQDPHDEPASELLNRIELEKTRLIKLGEIRHEKPLPLIDNKSFPFNLPPSWEWVPIRKIAADRGQKIPDKEFLYIDVSTIDKERGKIAKPQVLTPDVAPSRARKIIQKGDIIYSCVRPYLLNIAVVDKDFRPEPIVSTAFAVLNGFGMVVPRYLWIVLRSPFFVVCVEEKMRGQAYPAINDRDFAPLPFPLPPFAEQRRIVAKVDELMFLCDELESWLTKTATIRSQLLDAALSETLNAHSGIQ